MRLSFPCFQSSTPIRFPSYFPSSSSSSTLSAAPSSSKCGRAGLSLTGPSILHPGPHFVTNPRSHSGSQCSPHYLSQRLLLLHHPDDHWFRGLDPGPKDGGRGEEDRPLLALPPFWHRHDCHELQPRSGGGNCHHHHRQHDHKLTHVILCRLSTASSQWERCWGSSKIRRRTKNTETFYPDYVHSCFKQYFSMFSWYHIVLRKYIVYFVKIVHFCWYSTITRKNGVLKKQRGTSQR